MLRGMPCPQCGAETGTGARYCGACGHPLWAAGGERRVVSVLFADVVGFTGLAEHRDPEEVTRLVDGLFERVVADIAEFGGRVDKILGDAVVALFGAPVAHEDDAERAVRAALRLQETVAAHGAETGEDLQMRVGVNTGEVLVGALRAGGDYTAMGDVVNTASRLQTTCRPGEVLVGPATHSATADAIAYDSAGQLQPRGREGAIEAWVARSARRPPGHHHHPARAPMVGRNREMTLLRSMVELSFGHRRSQVVLLVGDAGVGKTRLANELGTQIIGSEVVGSEIGTLTFSGRCVPYGETNPWWPVAEVLREACGIAIDASLVMARESIEKAVRSVGVAADEVEQVMAGLLHVLGFEGPLRGLEPARARTEATESLLGFVEAAARRQPVMVRLADLHWADSVVLELIDVLAARLAREAFVLVGTARTSLLDRWTPRAGRHNVLVLTVDPLERQAAGELLDSLLEGVAEDLRESLLDRAGGNPFFLEELVSLVGRGDGPRRELPDTLRGLVAARIDSLSGEEQATVEDAAVWGPDGPIGALKRLAEATRGVHEVDDVVGSLRDKEVLAYEDGWWSFRSDLVREVAYSRLTKRDRLARHLGIATYLDTHTVPASIEDSHVDTVARHYVEAARLAREVRDAESSRELQARALRWVGEAARRAGDAASWPQLERLAGSGLSLLASDASPDGPLETATDLSAPGESGVGVVELLLFRAEARCEMWQFEGASADAERAAAIAEATGDRRAALRALLRLGEIAARGGTPAEAERRLDEAARLAEELGDVRLRGEASRLVGMGRLFSGADQDAAGPIAAALADFEAARDRRGEAWALQNLAWIAFTSGDLAEAEARLDRAGAVFADLGDRGGISWTEGLLAFVRFQQGRFAEAQELGERVLRESLRRGEPWVEAMMLLVTGSVRLWQGFTEDGSATLDSAVDRFERLGEVGGLQQALGAAGRARIMLGDIPGGRARLTRSAALLRERSPAWGLGAFAALAEVILAVQIGDLEVLSASPTITEGSREDVARLGGTELTLLVAVALAQLGRIDQADALVRQTLERDPRSGFGQGVAALVAAAGSDSELVHRFVGEVMANQRATYLDRTYGLIALGLASPGEAPAAWESARRELARTGDVLATACLRSAEALSARARDLPGWEELDDDASTGWSEIGVHPAGWLSLFERCQAGWDT